MRTRSGLSYPKPDLVKSSEKKRKRRCGEENIGIGGKKQSKKVDFFDGLPDDLVLSILSKLSSSAQSPSDIVSMMMTCKRMNGLSTNPTVLSKVSAKSLAIRAKNWSESAHRFLKRCVEAGSVEAAYTLGMIEFYCLENRSAGAALMAKAAMASHAVALYSLAIVQFNGSGGSKNHKDLRAGVSLCARSAYLGHVDALRELGHCLQDGYGVRRNVAEGRRFLFSANARELATASSSSRTKLTWQPHQLLSDFGGNIPRPEVGPANRFLVQWFGSREAGPEGFRSCSYGGCGRPETRNHEFRRCSVCGSVSYCSRACQALHWKLEHKEECKPAAAELRHEDTGNPAGAGQEVVM
ncbi:putative LRR receptor-like serine/threonine-protein kinase [Iris pallida]|uniref:LRR receptor-like serine/threonine-protein kinase n=1 Tax=Iris pallida TaxID=29817 RepID=A0AAX6FUG5_IRIPA|nr:putative LRR receptor-like serine/threonine-protein kinase [Iris pallida]